MATGKKLSTKPFKMRFKKVQENSLLMSLSKRIPSLLNQLPLTLLPHELLNLPMTSWVNYKGV